MKPLSLFNLENLANKAGAAQVLCIGAHSDDIEIGCGGTLLTMLAAHPKLSVTWVVLSADDLRADEANASATHFLAQAAHKRVEVANFKESYFPSRIEAVKDYFETLRRGVSPDIIFTHYRHDRHQDHRVVSDLTWNTFRQHLILEYEIPKYDGDLGQPNLFMPLPEEHYQKKLELLLTHFASQRSKAWFDRDTFAALMRLRGMESNAESRFAEAFYARKLTLSV